MSDKPTPNQGVESGGKPIVDPTKNVLDLVEAANKRQDDLRALTKELFDVKSGHQQELSTLRASHAEILRTSDLDRQEKTRQVDVLAAAASAAALATAVQTLAASTDRNAETIRNQLNADRAALAKLVSDTALNVSTQNDSLFKDVNNRIAELQKASYQGVGKSSVADPQLERLSMMVESLTRSRANDTGKRDGIDNTWKLIIAAVGLVATLSALGVFNRTPTQAIYTPAPAGTQLPSTPPQPVPR